jgi:hypothetical protein
MPPTLSMAGAKKMIPAKQLSLYTGGAFGTNQHF